MRYSRIGSYALALLAGLGVAACGSSGGSSGPSGGGNLSGPEAQAGALMAQGLATSALSTFADGSPGIDNLPDFVAPPSPVGRSILAGALYFAGVRGRLLGQLQMSPVLERSSTDCTPTLSGLITGDSPTDTDGDGVPDSVVATFTSQNCTEVDSAANASISYVGTVKVVDIGSLFGFRLVVDFIFTTNIQGSITTVHEAGTQTYTLAADLADLNTDLDDTISTNSGGSSAGSVANTDIEYRFVPAQGQALAADTPFPDGTLTIAGGINFNLNHQPTYLSFDIATPVALAYSEACGDADNNPPFTAGHITGHFSGLSTAGFDVVFTACGADPTVTVFGTTS